MKKITSFLLTFCLLLSLAGCTFSGGNGTNLAEPKDTGMESNRNPLTGEETDTDISQNCPIAVMLNNIKQALPQSGNSQADMFYEVPEEGGITRIMALYQDVSGVGQIGTIRSTRPYYVRLAVGMDAILAHCGGSKQSYTIINKYMDQADFNDMDCLKKGTNCAYSSFYRSQSRLDAGYATEHTLYTSSDNIQKYLADNADQVRTTHQSGYVSAQQFSEDATPKEGISAKSIQVVMSHYKNTDFQYDADSGTYGVSQFGSKYVDEVNGAQVNVKNVVVVQTNITLEDGDSKGRLSVELTGSGSGYYACGGKCIPITWEKKDVEDPQHFYDADGNQIKFGIGKTYICIVDKSREITLDGVTQEKPADAKNDSNALDSMQQNG